MTKKFTLVSLTVLPFAVGFTLDYLISRIFYDVNLPLDIFGCICLLAWFFLGKYATKLVSDKQKAIIWGHTIPLFVLALLLFQEMIMGRYFMNLVGTATQLYFLPLIAVSVTMSGLLPISTMSPIYMIAFMMMLATFCIGYNGKKN